MSESLIIHLRAGAEPQWLVCNDDGNVIVHPVAGPLSHATQMSAGRRVVVIIPSGDALTTESDAPAKSAAKLAQVIPYALEERVADEVEELHFAIGIRNAQTGRVPVVVVARARIEGWIAELTAAGLTPQAIYPEAALLPAMPGQLIALLCDDTITLRTADAPPLVLPALSLADAFEMVLAEQQSPVEGLEPTPPGLLLYAGHDEWQAHQSTIDALRDRFTGVKVQLLPSGPLNVLAPAAAAGDAVNLLQGAYAAVSPTKQGWPAWRIAAALGGVLLFLHLGARFFELSSLSRREADLDTRIAQEFQRAMPGQTNPTNARRRVQQRLAEVQGGGGGGTLLPALSAIASARSAAPAARIEGIAFKAGALELRMVAPDAATLEAISQQLRAGSWQAEVLGGSASGDGYRGRLKVNKG